MSSRRKRKFYVGNSEKYDFLHEEIDAEHNGLYYVYHSKPPYLDPELICLVFSNKHLNKGKVEWLVDSTIHPQFYNALTEVSDFLD